MGKDDGSYNIVLLPGIHRETEEECPESWLVFTAKLPQYLKNTTQNLHVDTQESTMVELESKVVAGVGESTLLRYYDIF